jgi:hypothetical protein
MMFFLTKAVLGIEPRVYLNTPKGGSQPTQTIKTEQTIPMEEFLSWGNKSDEEIDKLIEKQNYCLSRYRQVECE